MGLRDRIKGRIKKTLGQESKAAPPSPPPRAATARPVERPPAEPARPAAVAPPPEPLSEEEKVRQEKAAKHMLRTRKGVLKFVTTQGGTASLADMHKHSEMRYFVGHQKFSQMLEALISDGLIEYNHADGTGALTPEGQDYIG